MLRAFIAILRRARRRRWLGWPPPIVLAGC